MSLFSRFFAKAEPSPAVEPAYAAAVAEARTPFWYRSGVPDTIDGRFDMLVAVLALLQLECERRALVPATVRLTELFVDDMAGQARQMGIGDPVVSKHLGKMVSALGGRIGAFRAAALGSAGWSEAVQRNIAGAGEPVAQRLADVAARLAGLDETALVQGRWTDSEGPSA